MRATVELRRAVGVSALAELRALEREHLVPAYARLPVAFVRGEGARLWGADGTEYLDFQTGLAVTSVGHCHPRVVAAIQEQAAKLIHVGNLFYAEPGMRLAQRLASVPATLSTGVRTAIDYLSHPSRGSLAVAGAIGFWAAQIGVLWASFEAFGGNVAFGVLVQGFFVGMAANLIPSPAGGVGSVDAGMIGAFVLFGVPTSVVFPAVLTYRVIAFWLPIPPGVVAYLQLRHTVARWEAERRGYTSKSKVTAEAM